MPDEIPISYTIEDVDANDVTQIRFYLTEAGDVRVEVDYFVKTTTGSIHKSATLDQEVTGQAKTDIVAWFNTHAKDVINTNEGFLP